MVYLATCSIVIKPNGIFVIETKNYSGDIYGNETQLEWTQILSNGKVKNKFYNPIKQNATHVYNIKNIVGNLPVYSLVVFVQNNVSSLQITNVINLQQLKASISVGSDILTPKQMRVAYENIISHKLKISQKEHIKNIKQQQQNIQNGICPRCNGKLILRTGKFGDFYGCTNYPKCKFIKKI